MILIGIESTAHTLGVGVVESAAKSAAQVNRKNTAVLSNEFDRFPASRAGFIPRKLAEHHGRVFRKVLAASLREARVDLSEVDAIAFSQGPGIGSCLRIGFVAAKSLSLLSGKPLVPANHAIAHVEVGKWACGCEDPLVVYVSGGNTQIAAKQKLGRTDKFFYRVLGETLDVGIGNFLDVLGRRLRLSPPSAVGVMKQAEAHARASAEAGGNYFELPYTVKGMNLAFSGMQTAVLRAAREKKAGASQLCFSVQETAFAMLVEASERALCHSRNPELLLVGGVAQNTRLQEMYSLMCRGQKTRFEVVPPEYAGDQGAMIAIAGLKNYLAGIQFNSTEPHQDLRLDSQQIKW